MIRLNPNRIQTLVKNSQDIKKMVITSSENMFGVCPFTIILGTLNTTEAGYKPANLIVNNYTNFQKVFTGRESILVVWDNCYELGQVRTPLDKGGDDSNNYGVVKVKEYTDGTNGGVRYYGRLTDSAVSINFRPNSANDSMTGMIATKNVSLLFTYEKNERLFDEITNNIYKFWMIPELFKFRDIKNKDYLSVDRQWYYLENCNLIYDADTKKPALLQAMFVSVNDVVSKSGLAINQYIQVSAPGDRCCLPTVKNNKIVCDEEYLKYKPITHVQISFFGNIAFSSIVFMGRPVSDKQTQIEWKVEAPRFVFPHIYQASSYDELFVNAVPETNYYLLVDAIPTIIEGWVDWKDQISQTYNAYQDKQYEGFLKVNIDKTKATNQDIKTGSGLHFQYWDPRFLNDSSLWPAVSFNVSGSEYYCINPHLYDNKIKFDYCGETKINPPSTFENAKYSLATLNISTFFTHKQFYQLPIEITQTTPYALSSIPIIGRFLNDLLVGLPFGFRMSSNLLVPRIPAIYSLFSCSQFEYLSSIFGTKSKPSIPFDIFRKGTSSDIYSMCGTTSQTTSFCFNLSNIIKIKPTKIDGVKPDYKDITQANYNDTIVIDSIKLGQINKEKMEAYLLGGLMDLEKLQLASGYIIDSFCFQAIGQVPYRITFYSQTDNPQGNLDNNNAVWTGIYKTLSTASQNTRQWTNFMILSNPQYNFKENFYYPQNATIPPIGGEFDKLIVVEAQPFEIKKPVAYENNKPEKQYGVIQWYKSYPDTPDWPEVGFVDIINSDEFLQEIFNIKIDDIDFGLEKYTATKAIITLKQTHGKVFTKEIYDWGKGEINLSKSEKYWIYYVPDCGGYPFYAQDPGINGEKFDLTHPVIEDTTLEIDLTNINDITIDLSSSSNILNELPQKIPSMWLGVGGASITVVEEFFKWNWNFKGEYLKTCLNINSTIQAVFQTLLDTQSGLDIFFKEISNPVLTIKKIRDEKNNCWIIKGILNGSMTVAGVSLLDYEIMSGGCNILNRDLIENNIWYYINNESKNMEKIYYGVDSEGIDSNIKVHFVKKNEI